MAIPCFAAASPEEQRVARHAFDLAAPNPANEPGESSESGGKLVFRATPRYYLGSHTSNIMTSFSSLQFRHIPMLVLSLIATDISHTAEIHVAISGKDDNSGTRRKPLRTIQRAADLAQPGDTITIHSGTYRERVNPPRGGTSNRRRIVYRAAKNARVEVKGSEVVTGWTQVQPGVWRVTLANSFFGDFNPYTNAIRGDWFNGRGREHHTGAVYLNGDWLTEAATLDEVLLPAGTKPDWLTRGDQQYLLNLAWLRFGPDTDSDVRISAAGFAAQQGVRTASSNEGGECIGWIEHGDWVTYEGVNLGAGSEQIEIAASSAAAGGMIEIRLDGPDGDLLGICTVSSTGDWQAWATFNASIQRVSGVQTLCLVFKNHNGAGMTERGLNPQLWFGKVDDSHTTIWAQFEQVNPNEHPVEINVRQSIFYPDQPGRNFITVRGLTLRNAATPWAPPTAEQIGLIGTHWSKGWIIEDNVISHSVCTGITLGKHGDEFDNTSADTAEGYVKTIERAHAHALPWTRENIGHHVVRRNTISHCEQAGIVGSMGAAFSLVEGNVIHDIHVRRLFTGAEMAGIKFHAAIDTMIRNNRIYRAHRGLWLDWMTQGTRVSRNLFHDNTSEDLFVEVNHGPFIVDNNLFLSATSLLDMSQGGAYAHNLFAGRITNRPEPDRETPYHPAHSTLVAGLAPTTGGDNRFFNNLFIGDGETPSPEGRGNLEELRWISSHGLWGYDGREFPLKAGANVYYHHAQPYQAEIHPLLLAQLDPGFRLTEQGGNVMLHLNLGREWWQVDTRRVTTQQLGMARIAGLPYVDPDGSPLSIDTDYFGKRRGKSRPTPGPFEKTGSGALALKVW
jgi:alpha-L-arabinofuranosidase